MNGQRETERQHGSKSAKNESMRTVPVTQKAGGFVEEGLCGFVVLAVGEIRFHVLIDDFLRLNRGAV